MREILFRGITEFGDMVYGSLIMADKYCCILEREEDIHPMDYPYLDGFIGTFDGKATPVKPETVSQWTGLVDKNGIRVFEGDILKVYSEYEDWSKIAGYIGWNDNDQCYVIIESLENPDIMFGDFGDYGKSEYYEVMGNIWDNPELL